MIPPPFDYAAPKTLSEAVALLGKTRRPRSYQADIVSFP